MDGTFNEIKGWLELRTYLNKYMIQNFGPVLKFQPLAPQKRKIEREI